MTVQYLYKVATLLRGKLFNMRPLYSALNFSSFPLYFTNIYTFYFRLQGDTSHWSKPPVDIKTKVLF